MLDAAGQQQSALLATARIAGNGAAMGALVPITTPLSLTVEMAEATMPPSTPVAP